MNVPILVHNYLKQGQSSGGSPTPPSPPLASTATYHLVTTDVVDGNQSTWKNENVASTPSKNIIYNSSGLISTEGTFTGTITQHFANGPTFISSAAKIALAATVGGDASSVYYKPYTNKTLPVGNYTFKFKVKTANPGVTQTLKYGISSTTTTTNFTADDNWQTITINFTVASNVANNSIFIASQVGTGAQSILIDELQLYSTADTIPAYGTEVDGHAYKPYGIRNPITKNGNYITNSPLALRSPSFPVDKSWSGMTVLFAVRIVSDTSQILFSTITDSFYGTTSTTLGLSVGSGEVVFPAAVNRTGKLNNQEFNIIGFSFDATETNSYINEMLLQTTAGIVSAIRAQVLSIINRLPSTSPLIDDLAICTIWDRKLSPSEWNTAVAEARVELTTMSAPYRSRNWLIAQGDSITASFTPPQGESFAYQMATSLFTGGEYIGLYNVGTGGKTMSLVESPSQMAIVTDAITRAKLGGGKAIVSLLIGRNDNGTLISNAACDAYWIRLKAFYTTCRNLGAKVIAITPLPSGTIATNGGPAGSWETYRNYLAGLMRAEPSAYDALADFGNPLVSIMGNVATCEDATYYAPADMVHPYPAGHTILKGIFQPVVQSLL